MAKAFCGEMAIHVVNRCLQAHGGYGYSEEYPIARAYRDIRLVTIGGVEGRGFKTAMKVLDKGRIHIAAVCVGVAERLLRDTLRYAMERKQFGQAIAEFQGIQFMLADMAKDTQAARLLVRSAAEMLDAGVDATAAASMAKCFAGDAAVAHSSNAIQIFGGSGYIRGYEVERLYRDAKITQIYEGTNQVQRIIIARKLLNG